MIAITLFATTIVRRKATAVGITAGIIIASYFIDSIGRAVSNQIVEAVRKLSFFTYYDNQDVMTNGLNIGHIVLLLVITVILVAGSLWAFNRRDVGL